MREDEPIPTAPRPLSPEQAPKDRETREAERNILLGAARNAVRRRDYDQAIARYEEFFRRFGDDPAVRREYVGVLVSGNRLRQAAEEYQRLIARQPNDPELRVGLGDLYVAGKEYRQAIAEYRRALDLAPANLDTAARLARAYVFDNQALPAWDVVDRFLARLQPGDANVPLRYGALLIDLEHPGEAVPFLQKLLEQHPDDLELWSDVVRAWSRMGEREKAVATVEQMAEEAPRDLAARQALGDTLYQAGDFDLAGLVYEQILRLDPGNQTATVGTARVALQHYQPEEGRQILEGLKPAEAVVRIDRLTWGEYHQLVGEYTEAKQVYLDLLRVTPGDHEARIALAALDEYVREFEKAKAEYSKVPPESPWWRKARLGLAATLHSQRQFAQAVDVCRALLAENPGDADAVAQEVRSLAKGGFVGRAVNLARSFLQNNARDERGCQSVTFALGRVLLDARQFAEAARAFDWLLSRPPARVVTTYYGRARAAAGMGDPDRAQLLLATAVGLPGGEVRNRLLLSDEFAGDFDDARAAEYAGAVARECPRNVAALIRLADARQRLAITDQCIGPTVETCHAILALSPTNVRARLALARVLAVAEKYAPSVSEYDGLLALDPCFTVPGREKARVLYSAHEFAAADAAYQQLQVPCADEVLHEELACFAQKDPRGAALLDLLLRSGMSGRGLREEVARLAATAAEPEVREGLMRAVADYDGRCAEQTGAHLEEEAKDLKDLRNHEAIPVYQSLLTQEPGNLEALFDLPQVYGALRENHNELAGYGDLLQVDPVHREGLIAQERSGLELQPQLRLDGVFFRDQGRDGLARITRERLDGLTLVPWGDENEFVEVGYARVRYIPHDDAPLDGNILFARAQGKPNELLLLFAQVNFEDYPNRLSDRPTFEGGAEFDPCDPLHLRLRSFLENVVENGESLRQDIYRFGADASADYRVTRRWDFGGTARVAHYSDDNDMGELYLVNNVFVTFAPCQLKVVLDADLQAFAQSSVFPSANHDDLHGVIHPYFSPLHFAYYEARIEWTHWLSRDYFVHSNQCYYSLQYALGADSSLATYNSFRVLANFDIRPWLSVGADAQQILSKVYDATSANAYLVIRFPCCCGWW